MEERAVSASWLRNGGGDNGCGELMTLSDVEFMTLAGTPRSGPMRVPDFHSGCPGKWNFVVDFNVSGRGFRLHQDFASNSLLRLKTNGLEAQVDLCALAPGSTARSYQ
jgi:hypothetical protein